MKNKIQVLKEIDKNQTYQSIRFNNKQISDENIKSAIEEYFPQLFHHQKWKQITFFIKAMKDEEFYKKMKTMVGVHMNLEIHLEQIQQKQNAKAKIQDSSENGTLQPNKKKMTRAALAKRNQQTQEQLRKDQIYVRLTPKSQSCLQWMLCNRNFPRIQCKLSCNQHLEYLVNYLSNKWLKGKGNNKIVLYPDIGSYLKNTLNAKQRQKLLKEPLNNYFMFTDIMVGSGIGQNGILNLNYDILEKKKQPIRKTPLISNTSGVLNQEKMGVQLAKKMSNFEQSEKKGVQMNISQDVYKKQSSNNKSSADKYVPVNTAQKQGQYVLSHQNNNNKSLFPSQKNNIGSNIHHQQINNQYSNNFALGNESNLLNPNRNIYHDQESLFKSIGFFGLGGNNSIGFSRKNDYNIMSINSNSYIDIQPQNVSSSKKQSSNINQDKDEKIKSRFKSPKIETKIEPGNNKTMGSKQKQKSNQKSIGFSEVKEQFTNNKNDDPAKTDKLINLRNAINLIQQAEGFNDSQPGGEEISQKSAIKEIKTVSIKKKMAN